MKTNIEILEDLGILGDIRQRLGTKDENDNSFDDDINRLSTEEMVEAYSGWVLGDESWAKDFLDIYKRINEVKQGIKDEDFNN